MNAAVIVHFMNLGTPNKCRTLKGFGNEVLFPLVNTVGWNLKKGRIFRTKLQVS